MKIATLHNPAAANEGFTFEEFIQLCEMNPELELERTSQGILYVMPPVYSETAAKESKILGRLYVWNLSLPQPGEVLSPSARVFLPTTASYCPDAGWVHPETWRAHLARGGKSSPYSPEFVVELMSPSDRLPGHQAKMTEWIAGGVKLAWLIDPQTQQVWIYRPGETQPELITGFAAPLSGENILPGFLFDLNVLLG